MIENIPNGWEVKKLGDLKYDISDGNYSHLYPKQKEFMNSGVPFLRANNISKNTIIDKDMRFISEEKHKILKKGQLKKGDLLFTNRGVIGQVGIIPDKYIGANINAQIVRINSGNISTNKYLMYVLLKQDLKNQIKKLETGTTLKQLPIKKLGKLEIPIPSLKEQEKIVKVLDISSSLLDKQKELIENYDLFLKSKFIEIFGCPIQNPMKWEVSKLKELSTHILSGNTPKGGSQVYVENGIYFLRSQNVWKNKILLDNIVYIDNETHLKMKKSSLNHKDILMTKTGRFNTENSSLGRASLFLGEDNSANINGHVYSIRLKKNMIHEFVVYILTTNEYRDYIRKVCVGGIDKRQVNKSHLEEFPIIFPPIELQDKFASIVKKIDTIKEKENKKLKSLENLHNSLMEKAFKGEIE